jgi:hypothetical protein
MIVIPPVSNRILFVYSGELILFVSVLYRLGQEL